VSETEYNLAFTKSMKMWMAVTMLSPILPAVFAVAICLLVGPIPEGSNHTNLYGNNWASDIWEVGLGVSGFASIGGMMFFCQNSTGRKSARAGVIAGAIGIAFVCAIVGLYAMAIAYD
jgi:hypothetical protein